VRVAIGLLIAVLLLTIDSANTRPRQAKLTPKPTDQHPGCLPPGRIRLGYFPSHRGFCFQASDGSVALPAAGYDYDIDWPPMSAGLAPAGMAANSLR
jgi:hypothetical protein